MQMWRKRPLSETDCEDSYEMDDPSKSCLSPSDAASEPCTSGGGTRKRRRGIIEKRRRDRINGSLLELRRLVPSANEKQGSTKLEKAEILQLTVDHLKTLRAKGVDSLTYDPHKFALEYHNVGYRECAAEVARYLVTVEGLDLQDPLRLRLMSHLQCFAAQRDLANKNASTWTFPNHSVASATPAYIPTNGVPAQVNYASIAPAAAQPTFDQSYFNYGDNLIHSAPAAFHNANTARLTTPSASIQPQHTSLQSATSTAQYNAFTPVSGQSATYVSAANSQVRPYRPWGAELAY